MTPLDPKGASGATKTPLWLVPPVAEQTLAMALKQGMEKYGAYNWRDTSVSSRTYISAMMRHLNAWRDGEDVDPESGVNHLGHIMANCAILLDAAKHDKLVDDRVKSGGRDA